MSRTLRVDDIARHHLARRELLFFVWVTLTERKWVILAERRSPCPSRHRPPNRCDEEKSHSSISLYTVKHHPFVAQLSVQRATRQTS